MHILHYTAYGAIAHRHAGTAGLVEDFVDKFAFTETVEEGRGCALVHRQAAVRQQVRRQTHQLVHHHAYEFGTVRHLDAQRFLKTQAHGMTVHVSCHVVESLRIEQCRRVAQALAQFLDAAVNVARNHIDLLHQLTLDRGAITHHTVGRRVLRAHIDHIFFGTEHLLVDAFQCAVGLFNEAEGVVFVLFGIEAQRVQFGTVVIVLAQGVSHPVVAQEEAAHVGVIDKHDAKEVIHLTLLIVGHCPQVAHRVQAGILAVGGCHLHMYHLLGIGIRQVVDATQRVFPVHAHKGGQVVEVQVFLERLGQRVPLLVGHCYQQQLTRGVELGIRAYCAYFFLNVCHIINVYPFQGSVNIPFNNYSSTGAFDSRARRICSARMAASFSSAALASKNFLRSSLRLSPPRNFEALILRCNCIRP